MIEKIYKNKYMVICDNCETGKAILELPEMPKNCKECLLHNWESNTLICKVLLVNGLPHKRRDDCPLKPVETAIEIMKGVVKHE